MFEQVTVKIPGKLFIAGEYAVTRPQGLAIVAAIDTDFKITITESNEKSRLHTNVGLTDYEFDINDFEVPENQWNFALMALKKSIDGMRKTDEKFPQILLTIDSGLGFGENKKGYGSSASVVVGIVQAVNQFLGLDLSIAMRFKYAAQAHREVQGSGSMGDVAAISMGDVIYYQAPDKDWQDWKMTTFEWKQLNWQTYIVKTGKSVKTGEKLKISLPESFYDKSDEIVQAIENWRWSFAYWYPAKKFRRFKQLVLKNQRLLISHLPEGYVTPKLALALKLINDQENLVGKISGSGFGENIIVFAKNEKGIKKIREKLGRNGILLEKVQIAKEVK